MTTTYCDLVFSWPVNGQIYLPQEWIDDAARRKQARLPSKTVFQTKPEIALALIDQARASGGASGLWGAPAGRDGRGGGTSRSAQAQGRPPAHSFP